MLDLQIPSPYAAMPQGWPQQQQHQQQQQQGTPGQGQAPVHFPYQPFMPMLVPYGMPPPFQGMPAGPFRVHVPGHHPGAPAAGPQAGVGYNRTSNTCVVGNRLHKLVLPRASIKHACSNHK